MGYVPKNIDTNEIDMQVLAPDAYGLTVIGGKSDVNRHVQKTWNEVGDMAAGGLGGAYGYKYGGVRGGQLGSSGDGIMMSFSRPGTPFGNVEAAIEPIQDTYEARTEGPAAVQKTNSAQAEISNSKNGSLTYTLTTQQAGRVNPEYNYEQLMHMVKNNLDFSTAPNTATFWSSDNMQSAQNWASANKKVTLELTPGGQFLDGLKLFKNPNFTPKQAVDLWNTASSIYTQGASGQANVFSLGASKINGWGVMRTWYSDERPGLQNNPNVTELFYRSPSNWGILRTINLKK